MFTHKFLFTCLRRKPANTAIDIWEMDQTACIKRERRVPLRLSKIAAVIRIFGRVRRHFDKDDESRRTGASHGIPHKDSTGNDFQKVERSREEFLVVRAVRIPLIRRQNRIDGVYCNCPGRRLRSGRHRPIVARSGFSLPGPPHIMVWRVRRNDGEVKGSNGIAASLRLLAACGASHCSRRRLTATAQRWRPGSSRRKSS